MIKVLPFIILFFLFSGCFYPENKKISLNDGVYVGAYPHRSPLFVFTSWGHGYIVPDSLIQNNTSIDSIISSKKDCLYLFEADEYLIDTRFSLLSFDGKYAVAKFKGDFRQSSYCFLSQNFDASDDLCNVVDPECVNFFLKGCVIDYPTVAEQIKVLFKKRKHMSPEWCEVYNSFSNDLDNKDLPIWLKLRYISHRPRRSAFANYATISIEEPMVFISHLFPDERLLFDKGVLEFYKDDIFFDYRKNTYAFVLKGFNTMGEGHILFESNNGALISYRPHAEFLMKPVNNELSSRSLAYVEPFNRHYKDTVFHEKALFASLVSTLDEYFQYIGPNFFENLERERENYKDRGLVYE